MLVNTSEAMGRTLATSGVWEPHVTPVFRRLLAGGEVCVDVGAGLGYYTLLAAKLVGPDGHVYALEPAPRLYAALRSNLDLNGVSNVTALRVAAGAEPGRAFLYEPPPKNLGQSSMHVGGDPAPSEGRRSGTVVPVEVVTSLLREGDLERLRAVKIDVEGSELAVLHGLESLFEAGGRPSVLVELHPALWAEGDVAALSDLCSRYEFRAIELVDEHRVGFALSDPACRELDFKSLVDEERVVRRVLLEFAGS